MRCGRGRRIESACGSVTSNLFRRRYYHAYSNADPAGDEKTGCESKLRDRSSDQSSTAVQLHQPRGVVPLWADMVQHRPALLRPVQSREQRKDQAMWLASQSRPVRRGCSSIRQITPGLNPAYQVVDDADCSCEKMVLAGGLKRWTIWCTFEDSKGNAVGPIDLGVPCGECHPKHR